MIDLMQSIALVVVTAAYGYVFYTVNKRLMWLEDIVFGGKSWRKRDE